MSSVVVVGAQWGDEAKGKLVDWLAGQADVVVRYGGGNNAGHTVLAGGQVYKFHTLPAGILHKHVKAVLAGGMVICPKSLIEEIERTRQASHEFGEIKISSAAHVIFPYHRLLDSLEEEARGSNPIGTTARGIGPAYQDKVARNGIRMGEFIRPEIFKKRLQEVLTAKNKLLSMFGRQPLSYEALLEEYMIYAKTLAPYVVDTEIIVQEAIDGGKKVLFEGAQGTLLDLDNGTYPYVTSSYPVAGGACLGTGIGPRDIRSVLGVCKAYTTRVGLGPLPTELFDERGNRIREQGQEYGTTTGRSRRCGWLDLVALKYACRVNSLTGLVLTRLDVLTGFEKIRAAVCYRVDGQEVSHFPQNLHFSTVEPCYEEFEGWGEDIRSVRKIEELPSSARRYLEFIEDYTRTPIVVVSIGPDREETIVCKPEHTWGFS
jgi:adenylosuccinate synthase